MMQLDHSTHFLRSIPFRAVVDGINGWAKERSLGCEFRGGCSQTKLLNFPAQPYYDRVDFSHKVKREKPIPPSSPQPPPLPPPTQPTRSPPQSSTHNVYY